MTVPFICTTNTTSHIDYDIPISAYKSTDYRTSTGTYHRYIPSIPQEFDFRIQLKIKKHLLDTDATLLEDTFKTSNRTEYQIKQLDANSAYIPRPIINDKVNYLRIVQEKFFKEPPPPLKTQISEAKSEYYRKYPSQDEKVVQPPAIHATCKIKALGRDEQPPIRPQEKGYYKNMDPYMTTSRLSYIPFTKDQQDGIARKDIITFYDASGVPRGGKGYGPRHGSAIEPIFQNKIEQMHDELKFKTKIKDRIIPKTLCRIPNFGMQSEYQGRYVSQSFSDLYPHLHLTTENFPDSLSSASCWQNLVPPGMYCTDYCHLNTGWPVRCVINQNKPQGFQHDLELCRSDLLLDSNET